MFELIKKIWHFISHLGINSGHEFANNELKTRIFFNRCVFIGSFSLLFTLIGSWPFIGKYALLNLVNNAALIVALAFHIKGYFNVAKRIVVYTLFCIGLVLTSISGGDFLYHTGIITVLTFAWIMFSAKEEFAELILFFFLATTGYLIGELNPFSAPDFSNHPDTQAARIINLIGYTGVSLIFISFIRRLNLQYEQKLSETLIEKENLIQQVLTKTKSLELESSILEERILKRTKELRKQKEKLESQNTEKEVLLKEIHHRVKNNLQIIVSLLNLQASRFDDKQVLDAINETQNRIISMSLVHQRMYQTADFVAVEFKAYTDLLNENICSLFTDRKHRVSFVNEISNDLSLNIETAIPLGLVINELITNSFKHAFPESVINNKIIIALSKLSDDSYKLIYRDNGIGLKEDFQLETSDTLGMQLIIALIEQINGEVKFYNNNGAVVEITFLNQA